MTATATAKKTAKRTAKRTTLQLANPHMSGTDVKAAQKLLTDNPYGNFQPGSADGEFGPATAAAARQAKWLLGDPEKECDDDFGPKLTAYLEGKPLPAPFKARREQRLKEAKSSSGLRAKIVEIARWGIANEPSIHYRCSGR